MINVESVPRPLLVSRTCERTVQAVAKPVDRQKEVDYKKRGRPPLAQHVTNTSQHHRAKAHQREVVGLDPRGHISRKPAQTNSLEWGEQAGLLSDCTLEVRSQRSYVKMLAHTCLARFLT